MSLRNAQGINEHIFIVDFKKTWYFEDQKIIKLFLMPRSNFDL